MSRLSGREPVKEFFTLSAQSVKLTRLFSCPKRGSQKRTGDFHRRQYWIACMRQPNAAAVRPSRAKVPA